MLVEIDGLKLFYYIEGKGNPIILLHGWGANSDSLLPIFNYLKKNYLTISLDLPGFGKSDIPLNSLNGEDYKNFTLKFIKYLNLKNFVIIGHSFGGRIGIRIAKENLSDLKGLILIDSAGIREKKTKKQKISESIFKLLKNLSIKIIKGEKKDKFLEKLRNIFGSIDYKSQKGVMRETLVKVVNEDLTPFLKDIKVKTLIIWGEKDKELPIRHAYIMNREIQNSKLIVLKNCGHFPYLDNLTKVLNFIESFLVELYGNIN
ncbi:MAG: alpha/beta fold hydrolase [Caldisericia bacterium]